MTLPAPTFSQNDLIITTRAQETTPGVVAGGARSRVYGTAPTWAAAGNTITSGTRTGDGGEKSQRAGLRSASVSIPAELIFGANDSEWQDALRDTLPASELLVSAATVSFNQTGTQLDGSTGPVITAASGTFANLYDSGSGAALGCMLEIVGSPVSAANKRPRPIKAIKSDGTQIDLDPLYTTGATGEVSEPLTSQTNVLASVLRVGKPIRNRGIQAASYCDFEFNFADQPGGSFQMVKGCRGSKWKFSLNGKGAISQQFDYEAMDYDNATTTTQGNGTVNANPYVDNDHMVAGEDLGYFLIGATTQLAAVNLTQFDLNGDGSAQGVDNVSGTRSRSGVTVGDMKVSGTIKVYHEHLRLAVLQTLGRNGNRVPIDVKVGDPAGNFYWGRLVKALVEPGGPIPGAANGMTDGSFNIKSQLGPNGLRTWIWQRFAAL